MHGWMIIIPGSRLICALMFLALTIRPIKSLPNLGRCCDHRRCAQTGQNLADVGLNSEFCPLTLKEHLKNAALPPSPPPTLFGRAATVRPCSARTSVGPVAPLITALSPNSLPSLTRPSELVKRRDFLGFNPTEALTRLDGEGSGGRRGRGLI